MWLLLSDFASTFADSRDAWSIESRGPILLGRRVYRKSPGAGYRG